MADLRQQEVLRLLARGFPDHEIAAELNTKESTVKTHVEQVRYALSARNRAHAVARGYEHGLLTAGSTR
jgi:DNA-binding NarL/FixJ family response regulator